MEMELSINRMLFRNVEIKVDVHAKTEIRHNCVTWRLVCRLTALRYFVLNTATLQLLRHLKTRMLRSQQILAGFGSLQHLVTKVILR